jgi:hypothetical protein
MTATGGITVAGGVTAAGGVAAAGEATASVGVLVPLLALSPLPPPQAVNTSAVKSKPAIRDTRQFFKFCFIDYILLSGPTGATPGRHNLTGLNKDKFFYKYWQSWPSLQIDSICREVL